MTQKVQSSKSDELEFRNGISNLFEEVFPAPHNQEIKNLKSLLYKSKTQIESYNIEYDTNISLSSYLEFLKNHFFQLIISFNSEELRKDEENRQFAAFNLVDIGKKLEREKKYEQALTNFEKAIELFKSIDWDSYIQPVRNFIKGVKEKQENEEKAEELTQKRESELKNLQDTIYLKEREEIIQTARELDQKRLEHEQKRREEVRREEDGECERFTIVFHKNTRKTNTS